MKIEERAFPCPDPKGQAGRAEVTPASPPTDTTGAASGTKRCFRGLQSTAADQYLGGGGKELLSKVMCFW